ncbi:MAG: diphthine--ammonia ligase [archaeon]
MKLGALFSGGKDSAYAMFKAMGKHEIVCLITMVSKNDESYMFHVPNIHLTEMQAEAMNLPLVKENTEGVKEEELKDLKRALQKAKDKYNIEGITTGALASNYQRERIAKLCDELGLECINPLWGMDQIQLLKEVVENGFKVIISGIFAEPLTEKWLGKEIDSELITELIKLKDKYRINPAGEGGELESTVLDAPFFRKRIEVLDSEIRAEKHSGVLIIKDAKLVDK